MSNKIRIGEIEFSGRLTVKDVRRARNEHDLDLSSTDPTSQTIRIQFDPLVLTEVVYALYEERLNQKNIDSLDQLEDLITSDQIEPLREAVVEAVAGFFPLVAMVATKMKEFQAGSLDETLQQAVTEIKKANLNLSGMS